MAYPQNIPIDFALKTVGVHPPTGYATAKGKWRRKPRQVEPVG